MLGMTSQGAPARRKCTHDAGHCGCLALRHRELRLKGLQAELLKPLLKPLPCNAHFQLASICWPMCTPLSTQLGSLTCSASDLPRHLPVQGRQGHAALPQQA